MHHKSYCRVDDEGHRGDLLDTVRGWRFCLPYHKFAEPHIRHEVNFILPHGSATSTSILDGQTTGLATGVQLQHSSRKPMLNGHPNSNGQSPQHPQAPLAGQVLLALLQIALKKRMTMT